MTETSDHNFTSDDVAEHLRALEASARLIDFVIASGNRTDNDLNAVNINVRHIGIMRAMPHLAGNDLTPYTDAASRGSAWLAQD